MRGESGQRLFCYIPVERRIPADHPVRVIRMLTDAVLTGLSREFDSCMRGRPAIDPAGAIAAGIAAAGVLHGARTA